LDTFYAKPINSEVLTRNLSNFHFQSRGSAHFCIPVSCCQWNVSQ